MLLVRARNIGFIQFEEVSACQQFVGYYSHNDAVIGGVKVDVQQSDRTQVNVDQHPGSSVLLANIGLAAAHSHVQTSTATLDAMPEMLYEFFSTAGNVLRIIVFDKNGHAKGLIEFPTPEEAQHAKRQLDGKCLHSGHLITLTASCSPTPLKVEGNSRGRDYTGSAVAVGESRAPTSVAEGPVVLVSNVPDRGVSCRTLFNLFSTCGDVMKVKILHNNREAALIEFRNVNQANVARQFLNGVTLYGSPLRVAASSKSAVFIGEEGGELNEDFTLSELHRFRKPGSRNFNHIHQPSRVLHISNLPVEVDDTTIEAAVQQRCNTARYHSFKTVGEKKMGLATMGSIEEAVTVLVELHGVSFQGFGESPMKLSFAQQQREHSRHEGGTFAPSETSVLLANIGRDQHSPHEATALSSLPDVLYHFFSQAGTVLRVIVFEKGGMFKALIEFDTPTSAGTARSVLDGQPLRSGQVITTTNSFVQAPLKLDPTKTTGKDYSTGAIPTGGQEGLVAVTQQEEDGAGPVVLLSNLPADRISCRAISNLFSTCGDVLRVKILHNNRETALVMFRTAAQARVARQNFNGVPIEGRRVRVAASVKHEVTMPEADAGEEAGLLNQDFTFSELHRFSKPGSRNFAHVHPPSHRLHVSNIPVHISDTSIERSIQRIAPGNYYSFKTIGEKKMGTATMQDVGAAVAVLMRLHGMPAEGYAASSLRITFGMP